MVLFAPRRIAKLRREGREEGRREGREEGLQEGRRLAFQEYQKYAAALQAWYQRFKEAQANNQPFDEPPSFPRGIIETTHESL